MFASCFLIASTSLAQSSDSAGMGAAKGAGKDAGFLEEFESRRSVPQLHKDEWKVRPDDIDLGKNVYLNQARSTTDFKSTSTRKLLDFYHWKDQRLARDKMPDWKIRLSDSRYTESFGKFIQCVYRCKVYRELTEINAQYLSNVLEGDEIRNDEDSYAWIMMPSGALMRVSPKTSISVNEVNISREKSFYILRLNYGHIHWQQRQLGKYTPQDLAETDQVFIPTMIGKANREYYMRREFKALDDSEKMQYVLGENLGFKSQYQKLNNYMSEKKEQIQKHHTEVIVVTANTTIKAENASFDLWYDIKGSSYFRKLAQVPGLEVTDTRESKVQVHFRGYMNKKVETIDDDQWMQMSSDGKTLIHNQAIASQFQRLQLLIQRTPTIHLAREILLRKFYSFNFWKKEKITYQSIASKFNFRIWNEKSKNEIDKRMEYVIESSRIMETTSLKSQDKIFKNKKPLEFDKTYTQYAYDQYLKFLKRGRTKLYSGVKEMTDAQYYAWMLRYARKNL